MLEIGAIRRLWAAKGVSSQCGKSCWKALAKGGRGTGLEVAILL
jgi:hypothetical protein